MSVKWKKPSNPMSFNVPEDLRVWLRSERDRLGISMNAIFQSICYRAMKRGVGEIKIPKTAEEITKYYVEGLTKDDRKREKKRNYAALRRGTPGRRRRHRETF